MSSDVAYEQYRECRLCPRECRADRTAGLTGVCGETAECRVASYAPHHGEEPCLSGTRGSGTIFFSGCSCRCFFCQNHQISLTHAGKTMAPGELLAAARGLAASGVHNLNFVTPDHFWPHIRYVCTSLRDEGVTIPFIYNCSGYQRPELIPEIAGHMEIFLPDFKYANADLAAECMGASDYPEAALQALEKMVAARGFLEPFDTSGRQPAQTGVLVRHLVLPGETENSLETVRLLYQQFGRMLPLSVMSQFRPMPECHRRQRLNRRVTAAEYRKVCDLVEELGFRQVFLQPCFDDTRFVPDFEEEEPFRGNRADHAK